MPQPATDGGGLGPAEQDPETWWAAVASAARQLLAASPGEVAAVCVDGHGPTCVAAAADGTPTRPAITWLDGRPVRERTELAAATGLAGWDLNVLPAALWIARNETAAAAATRWYLNSWEWLALRLSGVAARTVAGEQVLPAADAAATTGLDPSRVPSTVAAGTVLGGLTGAAAAVLGLAPGIPVVAGTNDAFASCLGAGLLEPGDAIDTGGSAGGFAVYTDRPVTIPGAFASAAPIDGRWYVGGAMAATGRALDWFRDAILDGAVSTGTLLDEAADVPPGADGLIFLPYLAGERSPIWDPAARGVFVGLTLSHRRAHLVRAILEAASLAIRHIAAPIVAAGLPVGAMRVCGGPARSELWNQVKADVTGFDVAVPAVPETAVLGSGILGAVGLGAHPDVPSAIGRMVVIERVVRPRADVAKAYDNVYETYVSLYPTLAPTFHRLSGS